MFGIFKKKQWADTATVAYLMGISPLFTIKYSIRGQNGQKVTFPFRNEKGEMVADLYEKHVVEVSIHYQDTEMLEFVTVFNGSITEERGLRHLKNIFDSFIEKCPKTESKVCVKDLKTMQKDLHDQIEKIVNVYGWDKGPESKSNDIKVYLNSIKPEYRARLVDFLVRLDKCSVPVTINLSIDGLTDEMIGSTLNELAMFEMEDVEKDAEADEENPFDGI